MRQRTCALDLGSARVGLALDDELGLMAHPRGVISGRDRAALLRDIEAFVKENDVGHILVGLPLDMAGGEGDAARRARRLAQAIADRTGLSVELWDERLSTVEAARSLAASELDARAAKAHIDEASACVILQAWLDTRRRAKRKRRALDAP